MNKLGACLLLVLALPAWGRSVSINGINIDGVRNQRISGCDVNVDDKGNINITMKGYEIMALGDKVLLRPMAAATRKPKQVKVALTKRYYLVLQTNRPGSVQYDFDVYVNAEWVARLQGREAQEHVELTSHLALGENVVQVAATKTLEQRDRASALATDFVEVLLGETEGGAGTIVEIKKVLGQWKKTAAETANDGREFKITPR